jgi:DHA3 family macrolide efflux protein-like MFS transporter
LAALFAFDVVQIWHIYALMLLRSLGGAFHGPSFTASTSLMVPKKHLSRVQGLNQTLQGGLNIFAAPMGAFLLAIMPLQNIMAIDVITALIAVGSLLLVAIPQPEREPVIEGETAPTVWQDMKAGFKYVLGWKGILIVLVMATLINFLLTPAFSLLPLVVTTHFNAGALELGWMEASFGIGVVLGGLLLGLWGGFNRRIVTAMLGLMGIGAGNILLGLVPAKGLTLAIGAMFLVGVTQSITNGSLGAILQSAVDPGMQGRVFTLVGTAATAISPIGLLIAGPLSEVLGIQTWYLVGGIACIVMALFAFTSRPVMTIEEGRSAVDPDPADSVANPIEAAALDD